MIQKNILNDETDAFNYGNVNEREFHTYLNKDPEPSAWNKFPTVENPLTRYKFTSVEVNHSADRQTIGRQTYSILDWLGDMGGLVDALYYITKLLIHPLAAVALKTELLTSLFRFRESDEKLVLRRTNTVREAYASKKHDPYIAELADDKLLDVIKNDF